MGLDNKLVIAVSSRALFNLEAENEIFEKQGIEAYRDYQTSHLATPLEPGVAFPFIRRLLTLNDHFPEKEKPFKVVVLSRNSPECGRRFFASCKYHKLPITSGAFTSGQSTIPYLKTFGASLFLSANSENVLDAMQQGFPAGLVLPSENSEDFDDPDDFGLRIAFDFDGVIIDDESELHYQFFGLEAFKNFELNNANSPHKAGPLSELFKKLSYFQKVDMKRRGKNDPYFKPLIRISIVTARGAPCEERLITTLQQWGLHAAELFLLDGMPKHLLLEQLRPHIFFDDQMNNLENTFNAIPCVLVPFGINSDASIKNFCKLNHSKFEK